MRRSDEGPAKEWSVAGNYVITGYASAALCADDESARAVADAHNVAVADLRSALAAAEAEREAYKVDRDWFDQQLRERTAQRRAAEAALAAVREAWTARDNLPGLQDYGDHTGMSWQDAALYAENDDLIDAALAAADRPEPSHDKAALAAVREMRGTWHTWPGPGRPPVPWVAFFGHLDRVLAAADRATPPTWFRETPESLALLEQERAEVARVEALSPAPQPRNDGDPCPDDCPHEPECNLHYGGTMCDCEPEPPSLSPAPQPEQETRR